MVDRGLVVALPLQVGTDSLAVPLNFDPTELRTWVLYWDRIEHPVGGFTRYLPPSAEEVFLVQAGVMTRTQADDKFMIRDVAHPNDRGYFLSTIDTFRKLDAAERGVWALGTSKLHVRHPRQPSFAFRSDVREDSGFFEDEDDDNGRGLLVRLLNAIPSPENDVALEDVLEFKGRRAAELLRLRHHMETLYQQVADAPDRPLAEIGAVEALRRDVSDVLRSAEGMPIKFKLVDFSGRLNVVAGAATFVNMQSQGFDITTSAISGTLAAAVVELGPSIAIRSSGHTTSPFEYAAAFNREHDR